MRCPECNSRDVEEIDVGSMYCNDCGTQFYIEEVTPGTVLAWARRNLPAEDIETNRSDVYIRKSDKLIEMLNKNWADGYSLPKSFKSNNETWYEFPLCNLADGSKEWMERW